MSTDTLTHGIVRIKESGYEVPAVRRNGRWEHLGTNGEPIAPWHVDTVRPLVVIDLDDDAQVGRLGTLLRDDLRDHDSFLYDARLKMLLARLTGPIDEPRWLGAVVEDFDGKTWVRDAGYAKRWYNAADGKRADFAEIHAVRCLSWGAPGVER